MEAPLVVAADVGVTLSTGCGRTGVWETFRNTAL